MSLGVVRSPLGIGSSLFNVSSLASARRQLCVSGIVMLLSYDRPQLGVKERGQTNDDASNGVGGTPGPVDQPDRAGGNRGTAWRGRGDPKHNGIQPGSP